MQFRKGHHEHVPAVAMRENHEPIPKVVLAL